MEEKMAHGRQVKRQKNGKPTTSEQAKYAQEQMVGN